MPREYTPLPFEYFEEMQDLTDEEFGELMRALILYARDGKEISCEGKGNIFRVRLMRKDDHYSKANEEEEERRSRRTSHAKKAASARWDMPDYAQEESAMPEHVIPNQSNPNQDQTNPKKNNKKNLRSSCSELCESSEPEELPVTEIILNDGSLFPVYKSDADKWQELYPALDVMQQLRNIKGWCEDNPKNRKTRSGVRRFITGWLIREQNRTAKAPGASPSAAKWQYGGARREVTLTEFE